MPLTVLKPRANLGILLKGPQVVPVIAPAFKIEKPPPQTRIKGPVSPYFGNNRSIYQSGGLAVFKNMRDDLVR